MPAASLSNASLLDDVLQQARGNIIGVSHDEY